MFASRPLYSVRLRFGRSLSDADSALCHHYAVCDNRTGRVCGTYATRSDAETARSVFGALYAPIGPCPTCGSGTVTDGAARAPYCSPECAYDRDPR